MAIKRVLKGAVAPTPVGVGECPAPTLSLPAGRSLPPLLVQIAAVIGMDAAWLLVQARGGTTITLPRSVRADHWLAQAVGLDQARKLCAHFRADHVLSLTVPLASAAQKAARWDEALNAGLSIAETARQLGVHHVTVSRHRRASRRSADTSQGNLF